MLIALRVLAGIAGTALVVRTMLSAIRTFVVPRPARSHLARYVFMSYERVLLSRARRKSSFEDRDRVLALHAPLALISLPGAYAVLVIFGFGLLFFAAGTPASHAWVASGSSLTTLGFAALDGPAEVTLAVAEATIGLGLIALVITYLPTIYAAFQRREQSVSLLEVRAGSPPSAVEMLVRFQQIGQLEAMDELWTRWEEWFADIEESHTSQASLVFFRSPDPTTSWVTAAGAVLDAASLAASTLDIGPTPRARLCIRAGFVALRRIADVFGVEYDPDPQQADQTSISRADFDQACEELEAWGLPIKADRDQAFLDFNGWRVNYDTVLLELCSITMAPPARWSSDRCAPTRQARWVAERPARQRVGPPVG